MENPFFISKCDFLVKIIFSNSLGWDLFKKSVLFFQYKKPIFWNMLFFIMSWIIIFIKNFYFRNKLSNNSLFSNRNLNLSSSQAILINIIIFFGKIYIYIYIYIYIPSQWVSWAFHNNIARVQKYKIWIWARNYKQEKIGLDFLFFFKGKSFAEIVIMGFWQLIDFNKIYLRWTQDGENDIYFSNLIYWSMIFLSK